MADSTSTGTQPSNPQATPNPNTSSKTAPSPAKTTAAIPVGLNEAALDSPSFRAAATHFCDQADATQRWLDSYSKSTSKLVQDVNGLEDSINNYLAKSVPPPGAADGVVDTDFTLLALRRVVELSRERWSQFVASTRRLDKLSVEPIRSFISQECANFQKKRREFEIAQRAFDAMLARYMAQSKTKEASLLREDALVLYETRKAYLKASMDFCQLAPQFRFILDKLLVRVCFELWKEMKRTDPASPIAMKYSEEMDRLRGWSKDLEDSEAALKRELQAARRQISEATLTRFKPSRELDGYSASTVPFLGSRGPLTLRTGEQDFVASEKQGWLYTRMLPSRQGPKVPWLRRWYYCRNGIFGWLVATSQGGVVQGDEIGVLLCSAKPAVQEERRFCFELKTKTQNLMLQAETQAQLTEWLEVFEVAKKHAFEATLGRDNSSLPGGVDPAFSVIPPIASDFAAKSFETNVTGLGIDDGSGSALERSTTMAVPGSDASFTPRLSTDMTTMAAPRRAITSQLAQLGREDGESQLERATRLMQQLDSHRKALTSGAEQGTLKPTGIAGLVSVSQNLLPANYGGSTPQLGSPRPGQPFLAFAALSRPKALAPATFVRPPAATGLSKTAVVASAELSTDQNSFQSLPTVLAANYWGSSTWEGLLQASEDETLVPKTPTGDDDPFAPPINIQSPSGTVQFFKPPGGGHARSASATTSLDLRIQSPTDTSKKDPGDVFPPRYPAELKPHHAQFRMLFPNAPVGERLVLVFNASWSSSSEDGSPNQSLMGGGRIYVTPDNMYFYGHQMGLVTAYKIRLDAISEVTAAPGKECDFIFLHLGQLMAEKGFTRITIKTFLEDLSLLHLRLNLLVDNLQSAEPMDLMDLIAALINLEKEESGRRSPSMESWEEIPSHTMDIEAAQGDRSPQVVMGHQSQGGQHKPVTKFQLPAHPIIYEPEDMQQLVAERHYEISAKACFHVLFGDKSFIFPKLYFERRAKEISQGPWHLADHGKMQRTFKFRVECRGLLGRRKPADVEDTQTIEVFSDHITYVVRHVKTPWHLPHSQSFKLVTKVVITHLAKSKCKLAIYTKVDWEKAPTFSKNLVERQASNDAVRDAEELAEVATDQVRRLGPHSRTKRAIQVYGNVGHQTQVVVFRPGEARAAKKPQIKPRTLTAMYFETVWSFAESVASSLMMWAFAAVRQIFNIFTANRIILAVLAFSVFTNVIFTHKEGSAWWANRKAVRFMNQLGVGPNVMMSKAIYVADLDRATESSMVAGLAKTPSESVCYDTFRGILNTTDMDAPYQDAGAKLSSRSSKAAARRIRRTRQRLGAYRHDLVVAMRVVNSIEREMIQSEWENWLLDENMRCEQINVMLAGEGGEGKKQSGGVDAQKVMRPIDEQRVAMLREWHEEYCVSCKADQDAVLREQRSPMTIA